MTCLTVALAAANVRAQVAVESVAEHAENQETGDSIGALPGIIKVGVATPMARGAALSAFAGYGFLGDILGLEDSHHRASGELSATLRLADWIGFGVRFDGRYDKHKTSAGSDDGYVGDPRIAVRVVRELGGGLALGSHINVWFPGSEAPSVVTSAISVEATGIASLRLASAPVTLSANAGFRLDNSAEAAPDPMSLSLADRLALGLSESDAVLVGGGLSYRVGRAELLAELTYEYLLGTLAPPASRSPLEAAAGLRVKIASNLALQAYGRARLSKDPLVAIDAPLVAVSSRYGVMAGLHFQFGGPAKPAALLVTRDEKRGSDPIAKPPLEAPEPATLSGRIRSGGAPISDARVTATIAGEPVIVASTVDGDYSFRDIPGDAGKVSVFVEADGFAPSKTEAAVSPGGTAKHDIELDRILPPGAIKGVIRDFRGKPVIAKVVVLPLGTEVQPDDDGVFTVVVPPGDYEIVVEHPKYQSQRKQVRVQEGTTTILNLDLQKP